MDYDIDATVAGTAYSIHIPEDALLCVVEAPKRGSDNWIVEYGGYYGLAVPRSICREVPEDDEFAFDEPIMKYIWMDWESDCPYQLSVKANDTISVTKENEQYYYGSIVSDDDSTPKKEGWIQKSLFK